MKIEDERKFHRPHRVRLRFHVTTMRYRQQEYEITHGTQEAAPSPAEVEEARARVKAQFPHCKHVELVKRVR